MEKSASFLEISPSELLPNPWNTNSVTPENMKKLKASLSELGAFKPVIVRETDRGYEIIGGQHRAEAATELGLETIPVMSLGRIDDIKAKKIGLIDNGRYGSDDAIGLAALLEELQRESEIDLATFMPYSSEELDRIFTSVEFDLDSIGMDDDQEFLSTSLDEMEQHERTTTQAMQTHQLMRFKVPVEEADKVAEEIQRVMREQGLKSGDGKENAGEALVLIIDELRKLRELME